MPMIDDVMMTKHSLVFIPGIVTSPPRASVSLMRVREHNFTPDGVAFFRTPILPGCTTNVLLLLFLTYLLPFPPSSADIAVFKSVETVHMGYYCPTAGQHNAADLLAFIKQDETLMRALGPNVEISAPVMEARRTGGVTKSYGKHFIGNRKRNRRTNSEEEKRSRRKRY